MLVITRSRARAMQAQAADNPPTDTQQRMPNDANSSNAPPQERPRLRENELQNRTVRRDPPRQVVQAPPRRRQIPIQQQQEVELQNAMAAVILAEMAADQNAMDRAAADEAWMALCVSTIVVAWKALNIAILVCNARVNTRRLTMLLTEDFGTRWIGIAHDMWSGIFRFVLFVVALHLADVLVVRQVFSRRPMSVGVRAKASAALFLRTGEYLEEILPWLLVLFVW